MNRRAIVAAILIAGLLLIPAFAHEARAASISTVTISDPSRDVGSGVPAWQDIVSASVAGGSKANFAFSMTVSSTIPSAPALPGDTQEIDWWFAVTLNPPFTASGWPGSNGGGGGAQLHDQYFVVLFWDGSNFAAAVANRTPEVSGGAPTLTVVPISLQGATLSWSVAPTLLGSPTSFFFAAGIDDRGSLIVQIISPTDVVLGQGNNGFQNLDTDGLTNGILTSWP